MCSLNFKLVGGGHIAIVAATIVRIEPHRKPGQSLVHTRQGRHSTLWAKPKHVVGEAGKIRKKVAQRMTGGTQ